MQSTQISFILIATSSHLWVLILLSLRRGELSLSSESSSLTSQPSTSARAIYFLGLLSAISTLATPYTFAYSPLSQPVLRCVCFFYACKILDLSFAKADHPPALTLANYDKHDKHTRAPMDSNLDHLLYASRLLTEMRFFSFNVAVKQKDRPLAGNDLLSAAWTWTPPLAIVALTYLVPTSEVKCLAVLLVIQLGLETLHTIVHFNRVSCDQPLFYKPFAAASFGSFWTTHWHAAAAPFLWSLAYRPGKNLLGRWFGVLCTFNLTGIWHAWASMPLVDPSRAVELGFKVWMMFMVMGLGTLAERVIWGKNQGGVVQRMAVWAVALSSAGWAYRTLECYTPISFLRNEKCKD